MNTKTINLKLFSEMAGTGETSVPDAAAQANVASGEAEIVYGLPEDPMQDAAATEDMAQTAENAAQEPTYEELIKGKYKKDHDKYMQSTIQSRLKNAKAAEERLNRLLPVVETLSKQYGTSADDVDGILARLQVNDSYVEEEALRRGLDLDTTRKMIQLEQETEMYRQQRAAQEEQQQIQTHLNNLIKQSESVQAIYPGFDLKAEMENETFVRLTSPQIGIDVRTAYEVIHNQEIQTAGMQYAQQKASEKISQSIQTNARRPQENGARTQGQANVKPDPSMWTEKDMDEVIKQVKSGRIIRL